MKDEWAVQVAHIRDHAYTVVVENSEKRRALLRNGCRWKSNFKCI
jgi:hypothetical protein